MMNQDNMKKLEKIAERVQRRAQEKDTGVLAVKYVHKLWDFPYWVVVSEKYTSGIPVEVPQSAEECQDLEDRLVDYILAGRKNKFL